MAKEPMFLMLLLACTLYFLLGSFDEGFLMLAAIVIVSGIDYFQEIRSVNALDALRKYTAMKVKVSRDNKFIELPAEDIVPGDAIELEEGEQIPADSEIIQSNDLMVDESIITGESMAVSKDAFNKILFQGSTISSGVCYARVTATGNQTTLGKLGKSIENIKQVKTPLQIQTSSFVKNMAIFSLIAFVAVMAINFFKTGDWVVSLLFALTLAMSLIPEEIPVAFSSFMALGALRMARKGIITKQPSTVESLGSASVICLDKTGTITENQMKVAEIFSFRLNKIFGRNEFSLYKDDRVIEYAMWSSETNAFDPMEKAIHEAYNENCSIDQRPFFKMIHEYKLSGLPPMMTHVFQFENKIVVATKGAPERVISACKLDSVIRDQLATIIIAMAKKGYRILGVASASHNGISFPENQDHFDWLFEGFIAMYDPPKKNIKEVIQKFYDAGMHVKMITGDYSETALTIANECGIKNNGKSLTGDELLRMGNEELQKAVMEYNIFSRVVPEAKLKVVNALKDCGETVAMTGDGVNDGPALKAAHIGIAMGNRGTEIAKRASSLIITDDDLDKMAEAIFSGRRIYSNLKKAIRYIIAIHIPIILTVLIPLLAGWKFVNIFTPIHIIFFELIMGPTCSIFFENEPAEYDLMGKIRKSRALFTVRELFVSIIQGLGITAGVLYMYDYAIRSNLSVEETRTIVFATMIISNILLTFINRSYVHPIYKTMFYKNNLVLPVFILSVVFLIVSMKITFIMILFRLVDIPAALLLKSFITALIAVGWLEVYKIIVEVFFLKKKNNSFSQNSFCL